METKKKLSKLQNISKYDLNPHEKRALMSGHFSQDHVLFDDTIHVPLLFIGKNVSKEKIFSKQVSLIDILPTICHLADIDFDYSSCDGKNLFPLKNEEVFQEGPRSRTVGEVEEVECQGFHLNTMVNGSITEYCFKKKGRLCWSINTLIPMFLIRIRV